MTKSISISYDLYIMRTFQGLQKESNLCKGRSHRYIIKFERVSVRVSIWLSRLVMLLFSSLFLVRLGQVRVKGCPAGLKPPSGVRNRRKVMLKYEKIITLCSRLTKVNLKIQINQSRVFIIFFERYNTLICHQGGVIFSQGFVNLKENNRNKGWVIFLFFLIAHILYY